MTRALAIVLGVLLPVGACAAPSPQQSANPVQSPRTATLAPQTAPAGSPSALSSGRHTSQPPTATAGSAPSASAGAQLIPQPSPPAGLQTAPDSARVDLAMPTFSDPTGVDNPLFPVSSQESVLMLGHVDGKPFRTEVTLLADPRVITWNGLQIEALVSQYNAYLDGRINEVAYDYYAQDDAGNVWYLGEDVFDFADGVITSTEGTWLAGRDAPAAMIMPASPHVGDVYRTENAPPLVFEEVTVQQADVTLDGPLGPVPGGLVVRELHMDGTTEDKQFAPGYGEFYTADKKDLEALALAVPADALGVAPPDQLTELTDAALKLIDEAHAESWDAAAAGLAQIRSAWSALPADEAPTSVADVMRGWLDDLTSAVDARDRTATQRAAIEAARSSLDIQLRHRPAIEVELARMDLWAAEINVDAESGGAAGVGSDAFAMDYVRDRLQHRIPDADLAALDAVLAELGVAVVDDDMAAIPGIAQHIRETVTTIQP